MAAAGKFNGKQQEGWKWCSVCMALHFPAAGNKACAGGGQHNAAGSGEYSTNLEAGADAKATQGDWKWCDKCSSLTYAGGNLASVCAAGGQHNKQSGGAYFVSLAGHHHGQDGWKWCSKCGVLAYSKLGGGKCPGNGNGAHDHGGSGSYTVHTKAPAAAAPAAAAAAPAAAAAAAPAAADIGVSPHHVALKHASEAAVQAGPNQHWHYDSKSGFITGFDGRVLDVDGGSKEAGAKLIVFDKKPSDNLNQQWDYKDGFFYTRMGTGFVIDINGGQIANGTDLILWQAKGADNANQKWDIDANGYIRSRANNAFVVDIAGGKPGKGAGKVILWTASASKAQSDLAQKLKLHQHQRFHYDKHSGFITGFDGRVLDVDGASKAAGAKLILYPKKANDNANQQWDYKDGFFVTRMGTGFVIDINGGQIANGTDLILWNAKGADNANQKWDVDEYGCIRSRANRGFGVDVKGGAKPSNGATGICLWTLGHLAGGL